MKWRYFVSDPVYNKKTEFSVAEPTCSTSDFSEPATSKNEVDLSELSCFPVVKRLCLVFLRLLEKIFCF